MLAGWLGLPLGKGRAVLAMEKALEITRASRYCTRPTRMYRRSSRHLLDRCQRAWAPALAGALLAVVACKTPRVAEPKGSIGDGFGGLPIVVPPRRAADERGFEHVLVQRAGVGVYVDNSWTGRTGGFPIDRGVDIRAPGARVGTRYLVLAIVPNLPGGAARVGEVELTGETCPPSSDGAPLPCMRCPDDSSTRFATWVEAPVLPDVGHLVNPLGRSLVAVGPLTARNRERLSRSVVREACEMNTLEEAWWCDLAFDIGGDGQFDVVDVVSTCPQDISLAASDPRCFFDERWRWRAGHWWATEWSPEWRRLQEPARRSQFLEVFSAVVTPAIEPDERHTHDVSIHGVTGRRRPQGSGRYLLVDGRAAVALVRTGEAPENRAAAVTLQNEPRKLLFAIGPVTGSWAELSRARVRTDFTTDGHVLGLPYKIADHDRVVLAADLDADGRDEVELLASGAYGLGVEEQQQERLVRFDLWIDEGKGRYLREYMLYWVDRARVLSQYHCDLGDAGPGSISVHGRPSSGR